MRAFIVAAFTAVLVILPAQAVASAPSMMIGGGAINQPNIAVIFPGQSPWFRFSVVALQTATDGSATGRMTGEVFDWSRVGRQRVVADVQCLLVDGDRAVAWGRVTNADPNDPFWWFEYVAIVSQRMPDRTTLTNIVPQQLQFPPENCAMAFLDQFWGFIGYETRGAVVIH